MDASANPGTRPVVPHHEGIVVESSKTLDEDLRARLVAVAGEESEGQPRFGSMRTMLIEGAVWLALGVLLWIVTITVWG